MCRNRKCNVKPAEPDDGLAQCSACGAWWFLTCQGFWQCFSDQ